MRPEETEIPRITAPRMSCPTAHLRVLDSVPVSARDGALPAGGAVRSAHLPSSPAATAHARAFVVGALRDWRVERDAVDDAELIVSELVTNAFLHGRAPEVVLVVADAGRVVRLEVSHDERASTPAQLAPLTVAAEETHGRGLAIVDVLTSAWGVEGDEEHRRVWAELVADRSGLMPAADRDPALTDLAGALATAPDARSIGDAVTGWARACLAASFAGVALLDGSSDRHLRYLSVEPLPAQSAAAWERFPADTDAPVAAAFRYARPYFHESRNAAVAGFPELGPALAAARMAALAHLPLLVSGRPIGTLAFAWAHGRELDAGDRAWLTTVAQVTAAALARVDAPATP